MTRRVALAVQFGAGIAGGIVGGAVLSLLLPLGLALAHSIGVLGGVWFSGKWLPGRGSFLGTALGAFFGTGSGLLLHWLVFYLALNYTRGHLVPRFTDQLLAATVLTVLLAPALATLGFHRLRTRRHEEQQRGTSSVAEPH